MYMFLNCECLYFHATTKKKRDIVGVKEGKLLLISNACNLLAEHIQKLNYACKTRINVVSITGSRGTKSVNGPQ